MCKELAKILTALDNTHCTSFQTGENWLQKGSLKKAEKVAGRKKVLQSEHLIIVKLKWMYAVCVTADSAQQ